jgi:hypothetical protein
LTQGIQLGLIGGARRDAMTTHNYLCLPDRQVAIDIVVGDILFRGASSTHALKLSGDCASASSRLKGAESASSEPRYLRESYPFPNGESI